MISDWIRHSPLTSKSRGYQPGTTEDGFRPAQWPEGLCAECRGCWRGNPTSAALLRPFRLVHGRDTRSAPPRVQDQWRRVCLPSICHLSLKPRGVAGVAALPRAVRIRGAGTRWQCLGATIPAQLGKPTHDKRSAL